MNTANMIFGCPGGEVSLVQGVRLADLSFNPGWDSVVYISYLFLTCHALIRTENQRQDEQAP